MFAAVEILALVLLAAAGVFLGRRVGIAKSPRWFAGFLIPLLAIGLVIMGHRSVALSFVAPFSWAIDPWIGPFLMAAAVPVMLSTLIVRLPRRRMRIMVGVLMVVMVGYYALMPVVVPVLARSSLAGMKTEIGAGGVCHQSPVYTCGPASAVTCLRVLGVAAEEGAIAIEAQSGPAIGTDPILLARAINTFYAARGIHCEYRYVRNLDALSVPAIANIFTPEFGGHYIAVLEVAPGYVLVGDPLDRNTVKLPRADFLAQWTGAANVFTVTSSEAKSATKSATLSPAAPPP
jgi:hypothetical protein